MNGRKYWAHESQSNRVFTVSPAAFHPMLWQYYGSHLWTQRAGDVHGIIAHKTRELPLSHLYTNPQQFKAHKTSMRHNSTECCSLVQSVYSTYPIKRPPNRVTQEYVLSIIDLWTSEASFRHHLMFLGFLSSLRRAESGSSTLAQVYTV